MTYNAAGRPLSSTDARGKTSTWTYNSQGDLLTSTTPSGKTTAFGYDSTGRLVSTTTPAGTATPDPDDHTTVYGYDNADRITSTTDVLDRVRQTTYDNAGRLSSTEDEAGRTTSYDYYGDGKLKEVQGSDAAEDPTTYGYDANGNLTEVTDPSKRTETKTYDGANQVTRRETPVGSWSYAYDKGGNVTALTRPDGTITRYSYTAAGLISKIDYPTGDDVTFSYDRNGNRTKMVRGSRTTTYTYDGFDQLKQATTGTETFGYQYNATGQVVALSDPTGASRTLDYDDDSLLAEVRTGTQIQASYEYTPDGQVAEVALADGSTRSYTYDEANRLTRLTDEAAGGRIILDDEYTYDLTDNPVAVAHHDDTVDTYTYDTHDRLTGVCYDDATCDASATDFIRWTYDEVGNRLTEQRPGATTTYTRNPTTGQLTATSDGTTTTSYSYNSNGELVSDGTSTYTYDPAGRVATITQGGTTTSYTYDGDGRRLTAATAGGTTTKFLWDPQSYQLVAETDTTNVVQRSYTYGLGPVAVTGSTGTSYLHTDLQGSVREVTDAAGAATSQHAYEPFGVPRQGSDASSASGLAWAGQYTDPTGLSHLRARQYDPTTGAFQAPDPASATAPGATYTYADSNPMVAGDPLGLASEGISWGDVSYATQNIVGIIPGLGDVVAGARDCASDKGSCGTAVVASAIAGAAGVGGASKLLRRAGTAGPKGAVHLPPQKGQKVFRVYGGDSLAEGASWSPVDPRTVPNYRGAAGLPSGGASGATNTGQFVIEGTLNDPRAVVAQRGAVPLDGNKGGLPEYIIPDWMQNGAITIHRVSGANPEF